VVTDRPPEVAAVEEGLLVRAVHNRPTPRRAVQAADRQPPGCPPAPAACGESAPATR